MSCVVAPTTAVALQYRVERKRAHLSAVRWLCGLTAHRERADLNRPVRLNRRFGRPRLHSGPDFSRKAGIGATPYGRHRILQCGRLICDVLGGVRAFHDFSCMQHKCIAAHVPCFWDRRLREINATVLPVPPWAEPAQVTGALKAFSPTPPDVAIVIAWNSFPLVS